MANVKTDLMENKYFEYYASCPICQSGRLSLHFDIPFGRLKQKKSLDYSCLGINETSIMTVSKCTRCKFVFTNPRVKKECESMVYNESKQNKYKENKRYVIGTDENIQFDRRRKLG